MTRPGNPVAAGLDVPSVLVAVGTDHHPFDRLIRWVNEWLGQHPERAAACFVQSGTATVTPNCRWSPLVNVDKLDALLDQADVMVCHGGPASIADAWSRGQVPIVVPRLRRLGEHVDDHQLDFCVKVAELGRIRLAKTSAAFAGFLDEAATNIGLFRTNSVETDVDAAIARFASLVDELVGRPPGRRHLANRRWRSRSAPMTDNGTPVAVAPVAGAHPGSEYGLARKQVAGLRRLAGKANEEKE